MVMDCGGGGDGTLESLSSVSPWPIQQLQPRRKSAHVSGAKDKYALA